MLFALLAGLGPAACGLGVGAPTQAPATAPADSAGPELTATPSPTPAPEVVLLLAPEDAPGWLRAGLRDTLERLAQADGRAVVTQEPSADDARRILLPVVLAGPSGSVDWWPGDVGPAVVLLGAGGSSSQASVIGGDGWRYDRQGFLAGYIAAMISDDWRVAAIADSRLPGGAAILEGFTSGVRFFCGLCRQVYAPHVEMPLLVDLAEAGSLEAGLAPLTQAGVETVFLAPGVATEDLLRRLEALGMQALGSERPADSELGWVASIRPDPGAALEEAWPALTGGERVDLPMPLAIVEVDETRLSPGRLELARRTLERLLAGEIATGVEP